MIFINIAELENDVNKIQFEKWSEWICEPANRLILFPIFWVNVSSLALKTLKPPRKTAVRAPAAVSHSFFSLFLRD